VNRLQNIGFSSGIGAEQNVNLRGEFQPLAFDIAEILDFD